MTDAIAPNGHHFLSITKMACNTKGSRHAKN